MNIASQFLKQVIEGLYQFTGDYGVAIVLITLIVRVLMIPLNMKQRGQMERQRELTDEVERLKVKYKDKPQKLQAEMQKLYQEKGLGGAGCLVTLISFPIMMCLYTAIRLTVAAGATTVLLPWAASLLVRDETMILPAATLAVQLLPQCYPYIRFFRELNLQKTSPSMILALAAMNCVFVFVLPSGVGLYYFVSGLFSAMEQLAANIYAARRRRCAA